MSSSDRDPQVIRKKAESALSKDYFVVLGVARAATPEEVKRAFVEAAKLWHPDRVPDGLDELQPLFGKVFARLEVARSTLSDPARRERYIADLAKPVKAASADDLSSAEAMIEFRKADALLKKNDAARAEQHIRRAIQLAPNNAGYHALLVSLQVKPASSPEELKKLAAQLDRWIGTAPDCERAWFFRGQIRKRLGMAKEAHADFVRAAELDPNNIEAQREVRIYTMRNDKTASADAAASAGPFGFIKKLFKK